MSVWKMIVVIVGAITVIVPLGRWLGILRLWEQG